MSTTTTTQAHIAYELIDDRNPEVVVIEFLSQEIAGPLQARELGEQLDSLIRPDLPRRFVIDFSNVRLLGSTAFGEIAAFAHKVERLWVCNLPEELRLGAALIGLDDCAEFAANRPAAIIEARTTAFWNEEETVDYPRRRLNPTKRPIMLRESLDRHYWSHRHLPLNFLQ
jgi:anti-anti-sigma regulatory factor